MKRTLGTILIVLGLASLAFAIWMYPVGVRTAEGVTVPANTTTNWGGLILPGAIIVAMIWSGVALRRSGRSST